MQTPGRTTEPQTPMIPLERRMNNAYEALVRRSEENQRLEIERGPQVRQFGRIMLQFEQLNNNMEIMRSEIQRDIRARRRYFEEEKKLLKKDSDNLDNIRAGVFFELRRDVGILAAAAGVRDLTEGNFGNATENFGLAITSFIPEIAAGVAILLGLGGRGGARGGGVPITGTPRAGGGKWGWAIPIAAIAASLLMGQAATADQRRQSTLSTEVTTPTVNRSDSERFRAQLNRFDAILDTFGVASETGRDEKDSGIASIPGERTEDLDIKPGQKLPTTSELGDVGFDAVDRQNQQTASLSQNDGNDQIADANFGNEIGKIVSSEVDSKIGQSDNRWSNFMEASRGIEVASTNLQGLNLDKAFQTSNADKRREEALLESQVNLSSVLGSIESAEESENNIDEEVVLPNFEYNFGDDKKSWLDWRPTNPFAGMKFGTGDGNTKDPIVIENDNGTTTQNKMPLTEGLGPSRSNSVHTAFTKGGGAIDKFDYSLSLRTYASLSP